MFLKELIPKGSVVESYLLYSGEMELNLSSKDRLVVAHTSKYPVYEFWWMIKNRGPQVASVVEDIYESFSDEILYRFQETWHEQRDPVYRSALFYVLNRCSLMCRVSCGEIDRTKLSSYAINRFKQFSADSLHLVLDKTKQVHESFNDGIKSDYRFFPVGQFGTNLLEAGSEGSHDMAHVHHHKLFKALNAASFKWVVLYKFHTKLLEKYKNYNIILIDKYGNRTPQQDNCEDVIVTNF
jgi:hypothetical protein